MTILVAYATAKGSTRGIAERLGSCIEGLGQSVDVRPVADVSDVHSYDVIVFGSAIHNGQWLAEASDAVGRLRSQFEGRRVWAFSVSSVGVTSTTLSKRLARFLRRVTPEPGAVRILRDAADVRDHRFFAGVIAPGDWPGFGRVVFTLMGGHYGDARDWADVCAWAGAIAAESTRDTERRT
ncbi:flavodoxin domain-containing protein [Rhodococcus sp. JVH1]|uniref:flavodoxin domain-containing protein n=1 Tax=Rhodococcus sp. JVH1 TaxID=745408 RepID=UPI0005C18FBC|nr:flavodoxin domain-containing protein [Rhodococcus sp. JVH1]